MQNDVAAAMLLEERAVGGHMLAGLLEGEPRAPAPDMP